jgi:hypothetical protein
MVLGHEVAVEIYRHAVPGYRWCVRIHRHLPSQLAVVAKGYWGSVIKRNGCIDTSHDVKAAWGSAVNMQVSPAQSAFVGGVAAAGQSCDLVSVHAAPLQQCLVDGLRELRCLRGDLV